MATLESAARIIHRPDTPAAPAVPSSREPETESQTDLFTQDELFGVKKGQYIKKARARRIELAHENFTRARQLRPDGVTNNYRHAMLHLQIQNKPKPALHLLNQAVANWENLSEEDQSRRHQEKKNYVKSLYRSASVLLANGEALKALERIQTCLKQDESSHHVSVCFKYFALGKIQFCREEYSRAVDFFNEKWGNLFYEGLFWQALCAFKAGRKQQAETLVAELERACPNFPKLDRLAAMVRG
jgi:tetratricopeptide (TPR) repeat protein